MPKQFLDKREQSNQHFKPLTCDVEYEYIQQIRKHWNDEIKIFKYKNECKCHDYIQLQQL